MKYTFILALSVTLLMASEKCFANANDVSGGMAIGSSYAGAVTAPTNGLVVEGAVGIGTSSPTDKLTVVGTIHSTSGGIEFPDGTVQSTAATASSSLPSGSVIMWATDTAPSGYLECDGSAVSRTDYAGLFAAIGTTFGSGDGSTTFNLPDMRGYFPRGWADGGSVDSGRAFASVQQDAFQGHEHYANQPAYSSNVATSGDSSGVTFFSSQPTSSVVSDGSSGTPRTATETRPSNIALMFCIKS